jgi:hypothetical protein
VLIASSNVISLVDSDAAADAADATRTTRESIRIPVDQLLCKNGHKLKFCARCNDFENPFICGSELNITGIDEDSLRVIQHDSKQCPNCRVIITKNDGCNHITCLRCKQHFCWLCLTMFSPTTQWVPHDPCTNLNVHGQLVIGGAGAAFIAPDAEIDPADFDNNASDIDDDDDGWH